MFQRGFQLPAGDLEHYQCVFVDIEPGDLTHRNRPFGCGPQCEVSPVNVRLAGFELHALNKIQKRGIAKAPSRADNSSLDSLITASQLLVAIVGFGQLKLSAVALDRIVSGDRARGLAALATYLVFIQIEIRRAPRLAPIVGLSQSNTPQGH